MRLVSIDMLTPEMKIARAVYNQGALILPAGRSNVTRYIANLRNMGIEYVYVEDGKSAGIEIPIISPSCCSNSPSLILSPSFPRIKPAFTINENSET